MVHLYENGKIQQGRLRNQAAFVVFQADAMQ